MIVKRNIETYEDYLAALQAKAFDDPVDGNEAQSILDNFRLNNPDLYDKFSKMCDGIEEPRPIIESEEPSSMVPVKKQKRVGDKEQIIDEHFETNVKKLRNKARKRLMKGKYGLELPTWINEKELLASIEQLTISDLITSTGEPVQRSTLYQKCIKLAAASGRIDEAMLRQTIVKRCRIIWNNITGHPCYSFETLQWFIMEFATAEELADAGVDYSKLIDIMFDKRIEKLNVKDLRENKY